jgi:polyhydroxyalkanoate synthase
MVTMIDARRPNMMTTLATPGADRELNRRAEYGEVIDGKKIGHHFLWMRPKDLVYGNLVNNWVMGESPGAFDLMAWNVDAANISATYTRDSIAMLGSGGLVQSGTATVSGTPIDLSAVKVDNFIVAAQADHITTWRPVYMTSQVLGGESDIVLINKGHVQSAVSPIPKSRHKYWSGPATGPDPDRWLAQAEQHDGSWWPHWADWIKRRSGPDRPASAELGSADYPPREPAPGVYVHEK